MITNLFKTLLISAFLVQSADAKTVVTAPLKIEEPAKTPVAKDDDAIKETQELLKNPEERNKAIAGSPEAKKLDADLKVLLGDANNVEALYGLAADVFGDLAKEANGDPEKLKKIILDAQNDYEAFARKLSTDQQTKISEIGSKVEPPKPQTPKKK